MRLSTSSRSLSRALVLGAAIVLAGSMAGCSAAQDAVQGAADAAADAAAQATNEAASAAIASAVEAQLAKANIDLAAPPECTGDLDVDGVAVTAQGTVDCTAETTGGQAVAAAFDGSLSPTSCIGTLTVDVEGREPITVPEIDGCKIARLVGALEGASG
jgi:Flp pilus assembly protein TadG